MEQELQLTFALSRRRDHRSPHLLLVACYLRFRYLLPHLPAASTPTRASSPLGRQDQRTDYKQLFKIYVEFVYRDRGPSEKDAWPMPKTASRKPSDEIETRWLMSEGSVRVPGEISDAIDRPDSAPHRITASLS